jgi:hypothetical protein
VVDFMEETSEGITSCMAKFNCWRGMSAYPKDIFSEKLGFFLFFLFCVLTLQTCRSCAWINCRKEMAKHMYAQYCNASSSLPQYRDCVLTNWCNELLGFTKIEKV